jgi:hypothetical protein
MVRQASIQPEYSGQIRENPGKTLRQSTFRQYSDQENPGFRNTGFAIGHPFKPPIFLVAR